MQRLKRCLLRACGFCRPAPKTRFGHCLRRAERVLTILLVLYAALQVFPQVVFAHSFNADGITIYSTSPLPPETAGITARAAKLVSQSELAVPSRIERVFLCNSAWLYRLFAPRGGGFAVSVPITECIFVRDADILADRCYIRDASFNLRSLSSVLAHEITHGTIRDRLGQIDGFLLPRWIAEGYCDYVAQEGSFPDDQGRALWASGREDPSPSFQYYGFRKMVTYLIEVEGLSFDQIVQQAANRDAVERESRGWLQLEINLR